MHVMASRHLNNFFMSNIVSFSVHITPIFSHCINQDALNLQQGPPKGTTTAPRGRGRPKKTEEKPEITGEDEDDQDEEEEEEEN